MSAPTSQLQCPFTDEGFASFLESRDEPGWLIDRRRAAWAVFQQLDWPSRKAEEWMRTDIRMFHLDRYGLPSGSPPPAWDGDAAQLLPGGALAGDLTLVDSQPVSSNLCETLAAKGVLFGSLDQLVRDHGERIRERLFHAVGHEIDRFAALHAACWSGGALLLVPRGVSIEEPFHVLTAIHDGGTDLSHLLVVLEDGADATLLTETAGGPAGLHCGAVELLLGPRSRLRFVQLQDWGQQVWHFAHQKAVLGQDASLQWTTAALGSKVSKVNQHVALAGPGAESQVNGVLFAEGRQHLSCHTLQHHEAPSCRSDFLYKAALQDKARTVWRGMIKVDREAQKTDGYQRNDNLLLSPDSRADAIPGLEIEADDVRCTHGSTTGRVDEELIFYANCRGFTRREAVRMIVSGFFQKIFDRITLDSVRDALGRAIARRVREYD